MIEVEIRGPLPKKKYDELKKLFSSAGENPRTEKRVFIDYSTGIDGDTFEGRTLSIFLRQKNNIPEIVIKRGKKGDFSQREEIITVLNEGQFSNAVSTFAALGYTKGMVCPRDLFHVGYGGAEFTLGDPGDDDSYFYEAEICVKDPISAKEAKKKLEILAKKLKLPIWTNSDMYTFIEKLNKRVNYMYDYSVDGPDHFKNKFRI